MFSCCKCDKIFGTSKMLTDHDKQRHSDAALATWKMNTSTPSLLSSIVEETTSALERKQKQILLKVMDAYRLHPLSMNVAGTWDELNALTHQEHLSKIPYRDMSVLPTSPKKHRLEEPAASFSMNASLYGSIASGPYARTLLQHEYIEVNDELANFLNHDWHVEPAMRFACSRLLSGMIMLQASNGKAILVNTVEVYGRTRNVDSHHELFRVNHRLTPPTSLPPVTTRYPRIWPMTLKDMDGVKLIIGTKSFNALVTSSVRVDTDEIPDLGPTTSSFLIDNPAESLGARLFVMRKSVEAAFSLSKNNSATNVSSADLLYQLRQVRTRFHHPSTYLCCRSSSPWADDIAGQPYTIFTLANWDKGNDESSYRIASTLFQSIATCVMLNKELDKDNVTNLIAKINKNTNVRITLTSILSLFESDAKTIAILGNKHLNKLLATLANEIASALPKANDSVAARIKSVLLS
ncbi:hypothetical protein DM01DRAFT_1406052 [Hesseltinella vesiculosa]|uniref:C2H2-type domain-containing protein n=1 Tax=Hesseltinella vesiculosa TaxID=101127 RepID=A0A1X2GMU2_9FUNG|nr:hypothetical protein DM01DRAFT_1406052 [Hesseltinella vesiculosa]